MHKSLAGLLALCLLCSFLPLSGQAEENASRREAIRASFLEKADQVIVTDTSVIFPDAAHQEPIEVPLHPKNVAVLYASFATLWYEAGGVASGVIGGKSSIALYEQYIGRDITQDAGVAVLADTASGKSWNVEAILAQQPDLIICSTAMGGYETMRAPAQAAGIPLIAMEYQDFSDYLKWFKVLCHLSGHPELWEEVALQALDQVTNLLCKMPEENGPKVCALFLASNDSISVNTSNTVLGGMISQLGGINISDAGVANGAERLDINLEAVYAADPDLILVQCHASASDDAARLNQAYGHNPVWQALRAVREGRVYFLEPHLFHNKPNCRFAQAYLTLAEILYPEIDFRASYGP